MANLDVERLEKTFFWVFLSALLIGFFWVLKPFYSAVLFSLVIALICDPLFQFGLKFTRRRFLAGLFSMAVLFLFLFVPVGAIAGVIANQLLKLAQSFQLEPDFLNTLFGKGVILGTIESWRQMFGIETSLGDWIKELLHLSGQFLYQYSPKVVLKTANAALTGLITLFLIYFFLVDGPALYHEVLDLSPLKEDHEKTLAREIRVTLRACIYGYVMTALAQGILAGIGFGIAGIKIALLLGVATFIFSFIPVIGAAGVWVPVAVFLFLQGRIGMGIFMAIYGTLVISGIDNLLKPLLIQGRTKIHPMLLFLAIFGGLRLWGPIGILAGPTLIAVFLATLKIYKKDFR